MTPLSKSQIHAAARDMISRYGDLAFPRSYRILNQLSGEGDAYFVKMWQQIIDVLREIQKPVVTEDLCRENPHLDDARAQCSSD